MYLPTTYVVKCVKSRTLVLNFIFVINIIFVLFTLLYCFITCDKVLFFNEKLGDFIIKGGGKLSTFD